MKKIFYGLISLISFVLLNACSDSFLQKDSLTAVSTSTFWKTSEDALEGLAACYDGLQNTFLYNGSPYECGPLNMDCMTDNGGHFNWTGWMAGYDICNGTHTSSSWLVYAYWQACYEEIKRCNSLISNIDRVSMDADVIARYKAEAVVLRSLMYIDLTMTYNDVPYITATQSLTEANCAKTSRDTIVAHVMTDLKAAATVLPTTADSWGHVTKGAALALLGRVSLYNEKWDEAIDAYKQVIKLNCYALYPDYTKLFTEDNEECSEIIMSVRYEGPGKEEGSSIGGHWDTPLEAMNGTIDLADDFYCLDGKPTTDTKIGELNKDGSVNINKPNASHYDNRDPRLKTTLFVPGMTWKNSTATYGGAAASNSTIYIMKYFNPQLTWSTSWDSGQDFYIIRYAEVLLSLAEAMEESGSYNINDVISLVDQVRTRAGMPKVEDVEGTALSQSDLRTIIRHERRVETAFEGLRLFDLYRWKELEDEVKKINAEAAKYGFSYETRHYRGKMEYEWPIPLHEINSNPNLVQNPLWQ